MKGYPYLGSCLLSRRELHAAAERQQAGVGVWEQRSAQWAVTDPQGAPEKGLARLSCAHNYYRVSSLLGDHMMVFAPD